MVHFTWCGGTFINLGLLQLGRVRTDLGLPGASRSCPTSLLLVLMALTGFPRLAHVEACSHDAAGLLRTSHPRLASPVMMQEATFTLWSKRWSSQEEGHSVGSDQPSRSTNNPGRRTGGLQWGRRRHLGRSLLLHAGPQPQLLPFLALGCWLLIQSKQLGCWLPVQSLGDLGTHR